MQGCMLGLIQLLYVKITPILKTEIALNLTVVLFKKIYCPLEEKCKRLCQYFFFSEIHRSLCL